MTNGNDVLVVDDEPSVRGFISRVLSRNGYDCRTAGNAAEALAEADRRPPVLTITDIRMPGSNGHWLLSQLKERWPEMAVIMLTAVPEATTAVDCIKSGADDYLVKPIDLDQLLTAVSRSLERAQLAEENREHQRCLDDTVKARSIQLREALGMVEGAYQDTLEVLLSAKQPLASSKSESLAEPTALPRPPVTAELPAPDEASSPPAEQAAELAALRAAGKLIEEGASVGRVAAIIGEELIKGGSLVSARLWLKRGVSGQLQPVARVGQADESLPEYLPRAVNGGQTLSEVARDRTNICTPILVKGLCQGALELGWREDRASHPVPITERFALVLAAFISRQRDSEEWKRNVELVELFYKLASASRYSLDLEHVTEFIMESLHRIVDYDVAAVLLLEEPPSLRIHTRVPDANNLVGAVREQILSTLRTTCGLEVSEELAQRVTELEEVSGDSRRVPEKLRTFVDVPFAVSGGTAGLIHVSSARERAFSEQEIGSLHKIADFLATSVQGVREILATVKGRVEQMVDHMSDGVIMLDRRGNAVAMNGAARDILATSVQPEQPMDAKQLTQMLELDPLALVQSDGVRVRKLVCVHGVAYQAEISPVTDGEDKIDGAVVAFRNFEEEKRVDEMKTELVNIVSHELRTPLTAIRNAVALLRGPRLGQLTGKQNHFIELAQRNVEQLNSIVNDLLDLSKIEAGKMRLSLEPMEISEPIESVLSSLAHQAEEKGVTLEKTIAPDLPRIHGDQGSLQRVVVNLVGNALKFTDKGGVVTVEAQATLDDTEDPPRPAVRVRVVDSGLGIPSDELESIFDRFHQVHGDALPHGRVGTGLGLPISRELVKAHHGRIWAESELGKGSAFSFLVPVLTEEELILRALAAELKRAEARNVPLALVVASLKESGASKPEASEGALSDSSFLDTLREAAVAVLRRSSDQLFLHGSTRQLTMILPRTPKQGSVVFERRLMDQLRQGGDENAPLRYRIGTAVFPEDGASAEHLHKLAVERALVAA